MFVCQIRSMFIGFKMSKYHTFSIWIIHPIRGFSFCYFLNLLKFIMYNRFILVDLAFNNISRGGCDWEKNK